MRGTLPELLEIARRDHSGRSAIEDPETNLSLTYAELGVRAESVARALAEFGVRRGDRVGICVSKSLAAVSAIHGTMRSGAAYVPVDPSSPAGRNAGIFMDCDAAALVIERSRAGALRNAGLAISSDEVAIGEEVVIARIIRDAPGDRPKSGPPGEDDIAYILYTSGSTGVPKGVVHTHRSARAFVDWAAKTFKPTSEDRFSSHAPFHFDLSIFDLYASTAAGACVVLIGEEAGKQPLRLASLIQDHRITIWYSTPSALRLLSGFGKLEQHDHSRLRHVLFAGEVFPVGPLRTLRRQWPAPRYFNLYGPTETNVCTFLQLPEAIDEDRTAPYGIGHVCAGNIARVVNLDGREVSSGDEGELLIAGPTVMRDYWNLPERSACAFVEHDGQRWYRTGDIVRHDETGGFSFLGRRDRMVKRRGFRVELGEIEAALSLHPEVVECAVFAQPDSDSGVKITAALVSRSAVRLSLVELKQYCAARLPLYMVPDRFTFPQLIPQTSTGKVDYQRLTVDLA